MSVKFQKVTLDDTHIFNHENLKKILGAYEDRDIEKFYTYVRELKEVDLSAEGVELRSCLNIRMFETMEIHMSHIVEKYRELREKIDKVIAIRNSFNDYKRAWVSVQKVVDSMYERNKDIWIVSSEMKEYKNKDEKLSATNLKLDSIIKTMTYVDIAMVRIRQFENEIKETMDYLMDVKQDVSRIQSAISLALDTGEIPRTYWKEWKA